MAIVDRIYNAAFGTKDELEIAEPTSKDFAPDFKDCTSCRVLGSLACVSLGGWTYHSGNKRLRETRHLIEKSKSPYKYGSRRLGVFTLSATLVGMGLYRTFN